MPRAALQGTTMLDWRRIETEDGSFTLAAPVHGEACHSTAGAWTQARERYARACRLRERALEISRASRGEPVQFHLLDIGTGLGLNLAAALEALAGTDVTLRAVSLEHDARVLHAMLSLFRDLDRERAARALGSDLDRWHAPVRAAIASALAGSDGMPPRRQVVTIPGLGGSLELCLADARESIATLAPRARFDAVFLDPFSPRVEPELWQPEFLFEVARCVAAGGWLSTYTASLRVRASLAAAGLHVGPGERVGRKAEGTIASPTERPADFDPRTRRRVAARAKAVRERSAMESLDGAGGSFGILRAGGAFPPTDVLELRLDEAGWRPTPTSGA